MLCHFQSSPPPLNGRAFLSINERHVKFASGRTAGCDQTKRGCPASCRRHSHILELRRGQSTLKALFVRRVCMCVCVSYSQFPCSRFFFFFFFYQTPQSGRPDRESVEPLKYVINKMVKRTCMGSDPGSLLLRSLIYSGH